MFETASESLAHLVPALIALQRDIRDPAARSMGQVQRPLAAGISVIEHYGYASLCDALKAVRPALGRHGLLLLQCPRILDGSTIMVLETRIVHVSGEWIASHYPLPQSESADDPRHLGAALTYARRQSLFSMLALSADRDCDGTVPTNSSQGEKPSSGKASETNGPAAPPPSPPQPDALSAPSSFPGNREQQRKRAARSDKPDTDKRLTPLDLTMRRDGSASDLANLISGIERCDDLATLRSWANTHIRTAARLLPDHRFQLNEHFCAREQELARRRETPSADGSDAPRSRQHQSA